MLKDKRHTFVIRLWWEPSDLAPPGEWRGEVHHIDEETKFTSRDLVQLFAFVIKALIKEHTYW